MIYNYVCIIFNIIFNGIILIYLLYLRMGFLDRWQQCKLQVTVKQLWEVWFVEITRDWWIAATGRCYFTVFSTLLIFQVLHLILLAKQEVLLHLWKKKLQTGLFSSVLHSFKALTATKNQPCIEFKNIQAVAKTLRGQTLKLVE